MSNAKETLGILSRASMVIVVVFAYFLTSVYEILVKKPMEALLNRIIDPLIDVLDNEKYGNIIIFGYLSELFLLLFIPFFFSWIVGIIIVSYLIITSFLTILIMNLNENKKSYVGLFIILSSPHLILLLLPALFLIVFGKKNKRELTIIELRKIKLKLIKRKVRINKFKFWK